MNRSVLDPVQKRIVDVVEALGFGSIRRLTIRAGKPCLEPPPHIIQTVKLDSGCEQKVPPASADPALEREFENLFNSLTTLNETVVDIEVRHNRPFRLLIDRPLGDCSR